MANITKHDVELWIQTVATGEFHYKSVLGLQGKLDPRQDGKLRKIIHDLCKSGVCESVGRRDGFYRPIEDGVLPVDFSNLRPRDFPVTLPFDLRKYVFIYPDTTIIVAGSKSSGKTGFIYRCAELNWGNLNIKLLSNMEGGREQMYDRFKAMGMDLAELPRFIYPVNSQFHHYIKEPNTLYLIDYIDAPEGDDFYLIGAQIKRIDKQLQGLCSVAIIGLQKPSLRDTAFGGEQTLKVATLYIAMNSNQLKIVDAKVSADRKTHPKNMTWSFRYDAEGTDFLDIKLDYNQ